LTVYTGLLLFELLPEERIQIFLVSRSSSLAPLVVAIQAVQATGLGRHKYYLTSTCPLLEMCGYR
jgi:hypothetical protein